MKYIVDHDLHIHSNISLCANDPEQTKENILKCAEENGLKTICITDHFWDETIDGASSWYQKQNLEHISAIKPLPQTEDVKFLFGCETDMDKFLTVGVSKERFDLFDFIVIPTTHFHMKEFTILEEDLIDAKSRAKAWVKRFDALLNMDLPFNKVGIAHLVCSLIAPTREELLETIEAIPEQEMVRLFNKAAELGVGIEINSDEMTNVKENGDILLRPYRVAKKCGCKFYCGGDAHELEKMVTAKSRLEKGIEMLGLTENDKFIL